MPTTEGPSETPTYYEILGLSAAALEERRRQGETAQAILKRAYHKALLKHHPDKANGKHAVRNGAVPGPDPHAITIDRISDAFAVLSDPARRAEYDRAQRLAAGPSSGLALQQFQTGVEDVDLDDLEVDETSPEDPLWYRNCRCGNPRGYSFGEADLEEAAQYGGELMVGCADCSLWLRVHFAVVDDAGDEEGQAPNGAAGNGAG